MEIEVVVEEGQLGHLNILSISGEYNLSELIHTEAGYTSLCVLLFMNFL